MNVISAHKAKNYKSTEPGRVSKFSTKEAMPWISAKALAVTINPTHHVRRNVDMFFSIAKKYTQLLNDFCTLCVLWWRDGWKESLEIGFISNLLVVTFHS